MKAELKVKLLQHLIQKKQDEGFTLIEMLVVIIIIGILAAIALPSFLSQADKVRQSEAKKNVGTLNRAQQAYYFENQTFTEDIPKLGIGIVDSGNYTYSAVAIGGLTNAVVNKAKAGSDDLKGYTGGVFKTPERTTLVILCEVTTAGTGLPDDPISATACAGNQTRVK